MGFGTIVISVIITVLSVFKYAKYFADKGYKHIDDSNNDNEGGLYLYLLLLIPFFNLIFSLVLFYSTFFKTPYFFDIHIKEGTLEEMTNLEKEEYNKKPTGLNAIIFSEKVKERLNNAKVLLYKNDKGTGKIFFDYNSKSKKLTILKSTGILSDLSVEEQEILVIKGIKNYLASEINEHLIKDFKKSLKKRSL